DADTCSVAALFCSASAVVVAIEPVTWPACADIFSVAAEFSSTTALIDAIEETTPWAPPAISRAADAICVTSQNDADEHVLLRSADRSLTLFGDVLWNSWTHAPSMPSMETWGTGAVTRLSGVRRCTEGVGSVRWQHVLAGRRRTTLLGFLGLLLLLTLTHPVR